MENTTPTTHYDHEAVVVDGKELIALCVQALRNFEYAHSEQEYKDSDLSYIAGLQKQIDAATDMAAAVGGADREERIMLIASQVVKWYHQTVFLAWRRGAMTKEIESKFRQLPIVETANLWLVDIAGKHKKEEDEVNNRMTELREQNDSLEVFKAVLNGMKKEEAEKKLAEYKQQMTGAAGGTR